MVIVKTSCTFVSNSSVELKCDICWLAVCRICAVSPRYSDQSRPGFYLLAIYGGDTTTVPTTPVITLPVPSPSSANCHISEARIPQLVPAKQSSERA